MKYHTIILAGGSGERFGVMKQFVPLDGEPIFIRTINKFSEDKNCKITLVIPDNFKDVIDNCLHFFNLVNISIVTGGKTRQESVRNALEYIAGCDYWGDKVLITDSNRPLIKEQTIKKCMDTLEHDNALAILTVCKSINTSCISTEDGSNLLQILDRTNMWELLMPQGFDLNILLEAHRKTRIKNATDDMQIFKELCPEVEATLIPISFWEGLKLTHPEDYKVFETLLRK